MPHYFIKVLRHTNYLSYLYLWNLLQHSLGLIAGNDKKIYIYIYHWYIWNYYKKASEIIYISIYSMYITHSMWEGIFSFAATRSSNTWTRSFALSCMMSSLWTSASMLSTGSIPELVLLVERYHLWHCRFGYLKLCGFPRIEEEPKTNQFYVINHAWTNSYKYV